MIDLAWAVSAQERLQELGEMSRWISLKISDMPLMTGACSLPSIGCVIPYRSTIFDEALSGGTPKDDDIIEML